MRLFFSVSFGYTLLRQNRQTDQLAVDVQEHLWAVKTFFIVDQLFLTQTSGSFLHPAEQRRERTCRR